MFVHWFATAHYSTGFFYSVLIVHLELNKDKAKFIFSSEYSMDDYFCMLALQSDDTGYIIVDSKILTTHVMCCMSQDSYFNTHSA